MCAAVLLMRLAVHDGQKPRPLHENATSFSFGHSAHLTRTKPRLRLALVHSVAIVWRFEVKQRTFGNHPGWVDGLVTPVVVLLDVKHVHGLCNA